MTRRAICARPYLAVAVRFTPAAMPDDYTRLPLPNGGRPGVSVDPARFRSGTYPALSMDGGLFLAHLHHAAMRRQGLIIY